MKLESFTPGFPVTDEKLGGDPRHCFVTGSRGVLSLDVVEGVVVAVVEPPGGGQKVRLVFANGGVGRIAPEPKK